ncbi:MAG: hypothetical protein KDK41_18250, partial [Leptospiraceae bacterium]|nr:hypothetical protein [Leptospiraceae bacterium]
PFGMREPVLPLLLLAVLLKYPETMNLYREGSFVPVLNIETFEILMRRPEKFSIKFFKLDGLKETFFTELEKAFFTGNLSPTYREASQNMGRSGLMKVIRPLVKNVAHLPRYTRKTKSISVEAQNLLKTILAAREPDALLFRDLPIALGLPLVSLKQTDSEKARILSRKTLETLKELEDAYPRLLRQIRTMLCEAFQEKQEAELKSRLNVLGSTLVDRVIEPELKRFVRAAAESHLDETAWLESVAMVIADKPTHAWQDTDLAVFEARLGEISRRILNLEVILAEARRRSDGAFDARLLTLTSTDGSELRGALLVPEDAQLKKRAETLLADHPDLLSDEKLRAVVLLLLTEKALGKGESTPRDHAKNHVITRDA